MGYSTISLNGLEINVFSITRNKVPGTIKQKIGQNLVTIPITGRDKDWSISITGELRGTNIDSQRTDLENLDDANYYSYSDGILNNVNMIVTSLIFPEDAAGHTTRIPFQLSLLQFNQ